MTQVDIAVKLLLLADLTNGTNAKLQVERNSAKRYKREMVDEEKEEDDEPVKKRSRREKADDSGISGKRSSHGESRRKARKQEAASGNETAVPRSKVANGPSSPSKTPQELTGRERLGSEPANENLDDSKPAHVPESSSTTKEEVNDVASEAEDRAESEEEENLEAAIKAREKVQSTLKSSGKDPYPDWRPGEPVPYAALCTTFSLIEMTTKRLVISSHCSLFLRQVLRLTPQDLLPTVQLMINKLAADYAGIELGIGESLIMKAIGETTGRSLQIIKADQAEIGDLGLVAAKSRSNQPTMFKPKPLTVKGVLDGLMGIATVSGDGSQARKVAGIKKLLSSADSTSTGKGSKSIDITKDKGGASEAKFIIRFLEGKLRLGLAEKTVLVALAHAMVIHETEKKSKKPPSSEQLAKGESILKTVFR